MAKGGNFMGGLLLGTAIGVGVGLLYAPKPGAETREMLANRAEELGDRASEMVVRVRDRFGRMAETKEPAAACDIEE